MQHPIRIILPNHFDGTTVNAWLLKGQFPTLVDTGMKTEDSWEALLEQLAANNFHIKDLERIIITHGHADHMGLAKRISEASGAKVWVPEYLYPWAVDLSTQLDYRAKIYDHAFYSNTDDTLFPFESWDSSRLMEFWDPLTEDQVHVFKNDDVIQMGDHLWRTIYAPGHCINQVVFYQPEGKQLLSADMILRSTPVPYLDAMRDDPTSRGFNMSVLLDSFLRIDALDINHVYPGHFDIMGDPSLLIAKQTNRIKENIDKCLKWVRSGDTSFSTIINKLYPSRVNDSTFFMTISILDYLIEQTLIETKVINDKLEYYPIIETVNSTKSRKSANNEF